VVPADAASELPSVVPATPPLSAPALPALEPAAPPMVSVVVAPAADAPAASPPLAAMVVLADPPSPGRPAMIIAVPATPIPAEPALELPPAVQPAVEVNTGVAGTRPLASPGSSGSRPTSTLWQPNTNTNNEHQRIVDREGERIWGDPHRTRLRSSDRWLVLLLFRGLAIGQTLLGRSSRLAVCGTARKNAAVHLPVVALQQPNPWQRTLDHEFCYAPHFE
jgi:hypothetical protein